MKCKVRYAFTRMGEYENADMLEWAQQGQMLSGPVLIARKALPDGSRDKVIVNMRGNWVACDV